ncbi:helix-turn-helix transcriptional regulator [Anaeromyxobacter oryzae]|uniref:HTH luxR-type domain-containing protein n=1 Tax=Anaeromyxobacter oryzae TaxID=2918170 RepID=A0ABM7WY89_9BACT|nr:helix-turn-helix transcriptional regulator [Anaeromyxobacter oryzae]BDG04371.1 hypothetical protein AMOR_33670 [Anaeromyxobacter oryzae]
MKPKTTRRSRGHGTGDREDPPPELVDPIVAEPRPLPPEVTRIAPAALQAALAAIPSPAFLVRVPAAIACANARGEALLATERDRVQAALRHPPNPGQRGVRRFTLDGVNEWYVAVFSDLAGDARARLPGVARRWSLTPRQSAVLLLVAEGASNRAVAERLECSEKTVELHVSALLAKTRSTSRSQLVASFWTEPA